jgi:hypothetical protein
MARPYRPPWQRPADPHQLPLHRSKVMIGCNQMPNTPASRAYQFFFSYFRTPGSGGRMRR